MVGGGVAYQIVGGAWNRCPDREPRVALCSA